MTTPAAPPPDDDAPPAGRATAEPSAAPRPAVETPTPAPTPTATPAATPTATPASAPRGEPRWAGSPPPADGAPPTADAPHALRWRALTRRLLPYAIVAVGSFLVAYLLVFFFVFPSDIVPSASRVPNVVGLLYDDAENRLEASGFKVKTGETRFHATAPKGAVLEQSPRPGGTQPRGAAVTLDLSAGQRTATVPSVVGLTQQQAQVQLENAGFEVGDVLSKRGNAPRGQVLAIEPAAGQTVALPRTVTLTVSGGPVTITIPNVLGRTQEEARSALEQLGLSVVAVTIDSLAFEPAGVVTSQSPAAGASVVAGTGIRLMVSGRAP
jgi:serine/threonine-protein kinase